RINYHHRPELLRHPPHDRSQWADRAEQLDRLLAPPANEPDYDTAPDLRGIDTEPPWEQDDYIDETALLRESRFIGAELDFWQIITTNHTTSSVGLRSP
ncbi:hypothetical protein BST17_04145, partial [Mycolicibacterium bacteremicum]